MKIFNRVMAVGLFGLFTFTSPGVQAEIQAVDGQDANTKFEVQYNIREAERRAIIADKVRMTDAESRQFWPIYDKYRDDIKDLEKQRRELILEMSRNFNNLPDEQAEEMVETALALHQAVEESAAAHFDALDGIITGAKLFRYFQINARLKAVFMYNLTKTVPLVPSDRTPQIRPVQQ